MRFHLPEIPHARNVGVDISGEAYTTKTNNFCRMMMGLGHEVYRYGPPPGPDSPPCTEHVTVVSREQQDKWFAEASFTWNVKMPFWRWTNRSIAEEINKRKQRKDFLCLIGGSCQEPIVREVTKSEVMAVEIGIGYYGIFADYKVFESAAHMCSVYNTIAKDPQVSVFDAVIPGFYNPDDFPVPTSRLEVCRGDSPYLLFVGRIIKNKGVQIAIETSRAAGMRLLIAGRGGEVDGEDFITSDGWACSMAGADVTYLGHVTKAERDSLMANAYAGIFPTQYLEPLGNVVIEANMFGTPSITTNHGAFFETVQHGVTGFRCMTLAQFRDAVLAVGSLDRNRIRQLAIANYGLEHAAGMYQEYFSSLETVWDNGWYTTDRKSDLGWLAKAY